MVLVSDCPSISDIHANLSKSAISTASGKLCLTSNIACYQRVFAFDIDVNNTGTISNLTIEGPIMRGSVGIHGKMDHKMLCL